MDTDVMEEGGPVIVSFGTNVSQLTEGETVLFSAVVTDPDGVEDVIGGQLTNPDGSVVYGTFVTAGMEGAYEVSLTWAEIDQVQSIEFEMENSSRKFRAEFFDQSAKKVSTTTELTLHCNGLAACAGSCVDLMSDITHCGTCARSCDYVDVHNFDEYGDCVGGKCQNTVTDCFQVDDGFDTCAAYCASIGEECVPDGCFYTLADYYYTRMESTNKLNCEGWSGSVYVGDICDEILNGGLEAYRCCCTDNV